MLKNLTLIADRFIPDRDSLSVDGLRERRVLVNSSLIAGIFGLSYIPMTEMIGYHVATYILLISSFFFFLIPFLLKQRIGYALLANFFLVIALVTTIWYIYTQGGVKIAGITPWMVFLICMSMVFLGFRYALIWTIISILTIIVFLILEARGVPMSVRYDPKFDLMYRGLAWFGLSFIILIVINIFKNSEENAKRRLVQKNEELESTLETLKRTQEQLIHSEKLASLGQMTAGIAHEIQNPLNFIKNFSELSVELMEEVDKLKEDADMPGLIQSLKSNLVKIKEHSARTDKIVKSMLEHSRIQQSEMISTHVNNLCNEIIDLAEQGLHGTGDFSDLEIKTDYDPSNPVAKLVTHDTGRVLINLVNNAIYALKQQKKNMPDFKPVLTVSTSRENNQVIIRVKDNGPGIPADIRKDIFKPFYTTKPTGEGTGLGLSISNNIIQSQNGTLELEESRPGYTVFKLTFPES